MQSFRSRVITVFVLACLATFPATLGHAQQSSTQSHSTSHKKSKKSRKKTSHRGQQNIDPQRARAIQEALIREHYLDGQPSGKWDDASQKAMQKYQADHGWQSKTTPDSRALIQLGLGPDHQHLLNPESAMTTAPTAPSTHTAPTSAPASATEGDKQQN